MDNLQALRREFPITQRMIYLDAARMVPSPLPVMEAVRAFYDDLHADGEDRRLLEAKSQKTLERFAGLINARPDEVAFVKNTTEGLNIAANGLPLSSGDNVVVSDLEHLNNVYPWLNLQERKGVEIRILKSHDGRLAEEDLKELIDGRTRALAISFVTLTGLKIDLKSFGEICKTYGICLVVDAIQGVGRLRLDIEDAGIDILSCGGHKGLMAGRGIGCLFISSRILGSMEVAFAGPPLNLRHQKVGLEMNRPPGAKKFNAGGANYLGISALYAGLEFLGKAGIHEIEAYDLKLGELLSNGLREIKGVRILSPKTLEESSGIVSFAVPDNAALARALEKRRIRVSIRGEGIRVAPHFYNTEEEILRTVDAVAEALSKPLH